MQKETNEHNAERSRQGFEPVTLVGWAKRPHYAARSQVKRDMPQMMAFIDFEPGHRYADFDESSDRVAEYGLAALVAGGVAAKTGCFKGLLALLLAGKKLVIAAVVGIAAFVKKMVSRARGEEGSSDA